MVTAFGFSNGRFPVVACLGFSNGGFPSTARGGRFPLIAGVPVCEQGALRTGMYAGLDVSRSVAC
jgi:hypothetical protein